MKLNESSNDRIIRAIAGVLMLYLGFGSPIGGALAVVLDMVGITLLVTAAFGFCPLYALFKFSTREKK